MIGELIEKLCIANVKLFNVCNEKARMAEHPENYTKGQMAANNKSDIELCRQRAALKKAIDDAINSAIIKGSLESIDEVKNYG